MVLNLGFCIYDVFDQQVFTCLLFPFWLAVYSSNKTLAAVCHSSISQQSGAHSEIQSIVADELWNFI